MATQTSSRSGASWAWLAAACLFGTALLYLVWDLKRDVTASLDAAQGAIAEANEAIIVVNEKLPVIVNEVQRGTATLSSVAADVELIKSVAGVRSEQTRGVRELAVYANEIQELIADQTKSGDAVILIEEVFGSDLKEHESADEFLVGLSKEMVVVILPIAKSKQEILYRVCTSKPPRRKPFFIRIGDAEPIALQAFIEGLHTESAGLPEYIP